MIHVIRIQGEGEWQINRPPYSNGYPVYSGVMFCPVCKQIWAELEVQGDSLWEPRMVPCRRHPSGCHLELRPVAGSILDNPTCNMIDAALVDCLPSDLLEREFALTLTYMETL